MTAPVLNYIIRINGETITMDSTTGISDKSGKNLISITFTTDQSLLYFEARCTKADADFGIGVGNLLVNDSSISAAGTHKYNIEVSKATFTEGDGLYRIGLYAKGAVDGIWDVTYLLISSDNYIIAPSDYDGIEVYSDEPIPNN